MITQRIEGGYMWNLAIKDYLIAQMGRILKDYILRMGSEAICCNGYNYRNEFREKFFKRI